MRGVRDGLAKVERQRDHQEDRAAATVHEARASKPRTKFYFDMRLAYYIFLACLCLCIQQQYCLLLDVTIVTFLVYTRQYFIKYACHHRRRKPCNPPTQGAKYWEHTQVDAGSRAGRGDRCHVCT